MVQPALLDIVAKRRDRAIAIILGVKERECDAHLPPEARAKLRKVVLDQVNELVELMTDLMGSLDNGSVVLNEVYLRKIDDLHSSLAVGQS